MNRHFIPLALDTYFRGNSHEVGFCEEAGAGGNHLVAVTAAGKALGEGQANQGHVRLRERDLAPLLAEFKALPEGARRPELPDPAAATASERPAPDPPAGGLVVRGYCTYLDAAAKDTSRRIQRFYYEENPDAWAAETQSDMLWLTEEEWRSLLADKRDAGGGSAVPMEIQRRFFSTVGIDYMEGSVNALPVRESTMTLTLLGESDAGELQLRLDGHGRMGAAFNADSASKADTRGCELRVIGHVTYDRKAGKLTRFDVAGIGEAWGNKMDYTRREIRIPGERWAYGIACELVTGSAPYDRIPPYNMLHYGGRMRYFGNDQHP